jgi:hypothetical protein
VPRNTVDGHSNPKTQLLTLFARNEKSSERGQDKSRRRIDCGPRFESATQVLPVAAIRRIQVQGSEYARFGRGQNISQGHVMVKGITATLIPGCECGRQQGQPAGRHAVDNIEAVPDTCKSSSGGQNRECFRGEAVEGHACEHAQCTPTFACRIEPAHLDPSQSVCGWDSPHTLSHTARGEVDFAHPTSVLPARQRMPARQTEKAHLPVPQQRSLRRSRQTRLSRRRDDRARATSPT